MSDYGRRHGAAFALYHKKMAVFTGAVRSSRTPIIASAAGLRFQGWGAWLPFSGVVQL